MKYLQYLRDPVEPEADPPRCLPPLTIRGVQGKYGRKSQPSPLPEVSSGDSHTPIETGNRVELTENRQTFPVEFWNGPIFRAFRENSTCERVMTPVRIRALRRLLSVEDFEGKTGLSEESFRDRAAVSRSQSLCERKPNKTSARSPGVKVASRSRVGTAIQRKVTSARSVIG